MPRPDIKWLEPSAYTDVIPVKKILFLSIFQIGSKKLEEEFDELSPEEAKRRLSILVKQMDTDKNGIITEEELKKWIGSSFQLVSYYI